MYVVKKISNKYFLFFVFLFSIITVTGWTGTIDTAEATDYVINVPLTVGYVDHSYDLLAGVTVSPDTTDEGEAIAVRIDKIVCASAVSGTEEDITAQGTTITASGENECFAVEYRGVTNDGTVICSKRFIFRIQGTSDIGTELYGDFAYVSEAKLVEDQDTTSGYKIRTGSAPWDSDNERGDDMTDLDNRVRSFDVITYAVLLRNKVRDNAPYQAYMKGRINYEFIIPNATSEQAAFDESRMPWLQAKEGSQYTITEGTYNGQPCQVLRGSFIWASSDGITPAIGSASMELIVALRGMVLKDGDTIQPIFSFWFDGNTILDNGLVGESDSTCDTHDEVEVKRVNTPSVDVTAYPRYNLKLNNGYDSWEDDAKGTFDFSTGNDLARNKDAGSVTGRMMDFGIVFQLYGKSASHGLKGVELPTEDEITFDIDIQVTYRVASTGQVIDVSEEYMPLLWSYDGNNTSSTKQDGRYAYTRYITKLYVPLNSSSTDSRACYNGGKYSVTQDKLKLSFSVKDFIVELSHFPNSIYGYGYDSSYYYNPYAVTGCWDIQQACVSCGQFFLVQPFYNDANEYIVDKYGSGTFNFTLTDSNMSAKDSNGNIVTTQMNTSDDRMNVTCWISKSGSMSYYSVYQQAGVYSPSSGYPLTQGCWENGKDMASIGQKAVITNQFNSYGEEDNRIVCCDLLMKFDDALIKDIQTVQGNSKIWYAAKPDGTGWEHNGKEPDEEGYDDEMMQATAEDLVYYSSFTKLKEAGKTCVGILCEHRSPQTNTRYCPWQAIGFIVDSNPDLVGNVYMTTYSNRAWNRKTLKSLVPAAGDEPTVAEYQAYLNTTFPRLYGEGNSIDYSTYPTASTISEYDTSSELKNYKKAVYDENGYVSGTASCHYGDSVRVIGHKLSLTLKAEQTTSTGAEKTAYDMDTNQRIADFVIYPTSNKEGTSGETASVLDNITVTATIPKKLSYIEGSSYMGGTYESNGEGYQGTIKNGKKLDPISIVTNSNGTTTITWQMKGVEVKPGQNNALPAIHYACDIGQAGSDDDVVNLEELITTATIKSDYDSARTATLKEGNLAQSSIIISKNNASSISKLVDKAVVDVGDDMGFTLGISNDSASSMNVVMIDSMPYVGDKNNSSYNGECNVTELKFTTDTYGMKVYYTTDSSEKGKSGKDYVEASDITENSKWTQLMVNSDGTITLPSDFKPVAIAIVGTLPGKESLRLHETISLPTGKASDYICTPVSMSTEEVLSRAYILTRHLKGYVWCDDSMDGIQAANEGGINGIKVRLLKLKENGDKDNIEDYEVYKYDGVNEVIVETGKQYNVVDDITTTYEKGQYCFTNLPAGTFAVELIDGDEEDTKLAGYFASPANQGSDDTINSKGIAEEDSAGVLKRSYITNIVMAPKEEIVYSIFTAQYNDIGLIDINYELPNTGSCGLLPIYFIGAFLCAVSIMCLYRRNSENE